MAINRAPWTALVDDDGSNLVGSVWNKAAIKTVLLDPIDAMPPPVLTTLRYGPSVVFPMAAGAYNALRPPAGDQSVLWQLQPAGTVTINGILAEADQAQHFLFNQSGQICTIVNQSASAAAGNQIICPGLTNYTIPVYGVVPVIYVAALPVWLVVGKA